VPRPSSPLSAKASVRSPYALDRSQQNSCVGTVAARGTKLRAAPTHALCIQTMMSSRIQPQTPGGSGGTLQFTMSDATSAKAEVETRCFPRSRRCPSRKGWWSQTGSNRRPHACKARALPTELWPLIPGRPAAAGSPGKSRECRSSSCPPEVSHEVWWAQADSNCRPHAYQACALTN
jgi:hypothetical protein